MHLKDILSGEYFDSGKSQPRCPSSITAACTVLLAECQLGQALKLLEEGSFGKARLLLRSCQEVIKLSVETETSEGEEPLENMYGLNKLLGDVCSAFFLFPWEEKGERLKALQEGQKAYERAITIDGSHFFA